MSFYQAVVAGCILFIVCVDERLGNRADYGLHMQIKGVLQILTAAGGARLRLPAVPGNLQLYAPKRNQ